MWVGSQSDWSEATTTKVAADLFDNTFNEIDTPVAGTYMWIRRDTVDQTDFNL